jgi:hypothetical protein
MPVFRPRRLVFTGAGHGGCGGGGGVRGYIWACEGRPQSHVYTVAQTHTHVALTAGCNLYPHWQHGLSIFILMLRHICPGVTNCRHDQLLVHPTREYWKFTTVWNVWTYCSDKDIGWYFLKFSLYSFGLTWLTVVLAWFLSSCLDFLLY